MNTRELVDHIRSGPEKLVLDKTLRFRVPTPSNPCTFNEFLQALQSSETIRHIICQSHLDLGISEEEWVLLIMAIGRIRDIQNLILFCKPGSHDFHPFEALTDAVNNAQSLRKLGVNVFPSEPSELIALANALQQHTALQEFIWYDIGHWREAAPPDFSVDTILRALPASPHLRKVFIATERASADAWKELLQMHLATDLYLALKKECWLAVSDEIRQGRCNVQRLTMSLFRGRVSETTEAVQVVASAIQMDHNLTHLELYVSKGFTDEAGVALAEALTVNTSLRTIKLTTLGRNRATLGVPAYEAFSAMLRVNTSLMLMVPPILTADADERVRESRDQMRIEQRLNTVGRGRLLASSQTTKEQWADALYELHSGRDVVSPMNVDDDTPAFRVSCLYSVLRSDPTVVYMS
jgi:hypothetical protein